jgi:hypothetical protein
MLWRDMMEMMLYMLYVMADDMMEMMLYILYVMADDMKEMMLHKHAWHMTL